MADKGVIDCICKAFFEISMDEYEELKIKDKKKYNSIEKDKKREYLDLADEIKKCYEKDSQLARDKYKDVFYYFDGLLNTAVSESVHPAGIIISPITLSDNYGCYYNKDGLLVSCVNMEEVHECGLVKYDILGLINISILKETCDLIGIKYPKSYEINWNDKDVWGHILDSPVGIFQMESDYAFDIMKRYKPKTINELSIANACIRPSSASFRDRLINREPNKNPSEIIDKLLEKNNGYLCIEENQKISTLEGLKPIKNINVGDIVYTTNGLEKVNKVYDNGIKDVYELKTKYGKVVCTDNHKILTENGWKEYKDINIGESICHYVGTMSKKDYDRDKLKIIGWFLGDGITSRNNIGFVNLDYEVVSSFKSSVENTWNNLAVSIKNRESKINKIPLYYCNVKWKDKPHKYNKPIHDYFLEIGIRGKHAVDKFIPDFIFSLNRECLLTFLGAYTDTDSCLRNNTINYKIASKMLCDGIVEVLRLLGYSSSINKNKESYNICVMGANELLKELYNYSIKVRKQCKGNIVKRKNRLGEISYSNVEKWIKQYGISKKRIQKDLGITLYNKKYIRIESIIKISGKYNITPPVILSDFIHYMPVESKTKVGNKRVFDLEINNTHNFIANGIVVHNCFQEDVIAFLQNICGLSGGEADNIRRAIGRKDYERLQRAMPDILNGYCSKSDKERDEAIKEAETFLKIIEDASSYMFGYNHSTGYSMIGYLCGYFRYYYPLEFITAYLNNPQSDEDIVNGTKLAKQMNIKIRPPKFRYSKGKYFPSKEDNSIYKGIGSIKYLNNGVGEELYALKDNKYDDFIDLLKDLQNTSINSRQLDILIKLDFFDEFGKSAKLLEIVNIFNKYYDKKQFKKENIDEKHLEIFKKYSVKETEKMFTQVDTVLLVKELCKDIPNKDIPIRDILESEKEYLGYVSYKNEEYDETANVITEVKINKYGTPFVDIYNLKTGKSTNIKVDKMYFNNKPLSQYDTIVIKNIDNKRKKRKIDGKWQFIDEYETILTSYSMVVEDE